MHCPLSLIRSVYGIQTPVICVFCCRVASPRNWLDFLREEERERHRALRAECHGLSNVILLLDFTKCDRRRPKHTEHFTLSRIHITIANYGQRRKAKSFVWDYKYYPYTHFQVLFDNLDLFKNILGLSRLPNKTQNSVTVSVTKLVVDSNFRMVFQEHLLDNGFSFFLSLYSLVGPSQKFNISLISNQQFSPKLTKVYRCCALLNVLELYGLFPAWTSHWPLYSSDINMSKEKHSHG